MKLSYFLLFYSAASIDFYLLFFSLPFFAVYPFNLFRFSFLFLFKPQKPRVHQILKSFFELLVRTFDFLLFALPATCSNLIFVFISLFLRNNSPLCVKPSKEKVLKKTLFFFFLSNIERELKETDHVTSCQSVVTRQIISFFEFEYSC